MRFPPSVIETANAEDSTEIQESQKKPSVEGDIEIKDIAQILDFWQEVSRVCDPHFGIIAH